MTDEQEIRELVDRWMAATKSGDTATVLELIADDAIFMVPGSEPFGKEAFRAASESLSDVELDGLAEIRELHVEGDWAWIRNHIDLRMMRANSEPMRRTGCTLTILRKNEDGRWRLYRDANLVS